jgi:L-aminopeptidase/D-esterase-like protein
MTLRNTITDVPGIEVGQANDEAALTGCTVVLCRKGAVGGVDVRGSAPGTRETDLLDPVNLVEEVHAVVLAGGSAFGLDAASGVMKYLAEKKIGYGLGAQRVPIVPAAILFDLGLGKSNRHPDPEMGYAAAAAASSGPVEEGNAGAGTGATVGKIFGMAGAMKSGLGTVSLDIGGGVIVGALVAVNAFGDVIDPSSGQILAGARPAKLGPVKLGGKGRFADTMEVMKSLAGRTIFSLATGGNTGIAVVATNAK